MKEGELVHHLEDRNGNLLPTGASFYDNPSAYRLALGLLLNLNELQKERAEKFEFVVGKNYARFLLNCGDKLTSEIKAEVLPESQFLVTAGQNVLDMVSYFDNLEMSFNIFLAHATGYDQEIRKTLGTMGLLGRKERISFVKDLEVHKQVSERSKLKNYIKKTTVKGTPRVK